MTCYLAATRRWITRTKLTPSPPHTGPSENNAILEDQLKTHRRRQTQTTKKKNADKHALILIYCTDMQRPPPPATPSAACRPVNTRKHGRAPFFFLYASAGHRRTDTAVDTQKDLAGTQNTHCRSFICLCFIL